MKGFIERPLAMFHPKKSLKKGFRFISNCQRQGKKARHACRGEVGNRTQDLWVVSQALWPTALVAQPQKLLMWLLII